MKQLPVTPAKSEQTGSLAYLALKYLALPTVLLSLNQLLPNPLNDTRLNLVFSLISYLAVGLILRKFIGRSFLEAKPERILFFALLGLLMHWALRLGTSYLTLLVKPDFTNVNDAAISGMMQEEFLLSVLTAVVLVPPCEELLFRGVIFGGLYNKHPVAAYLISAFAFSSIHVVGYVGLFSWDTLVLCFLQYIPTGIVLGWAYVRSGNILTPILIHTLVNATGVAIMR